MHVDRVRLPYAPRPGQQELVDHIAETHRRHGHLVAEAGTGTGKTTCALTGSLGEGPVIYATRTNSQQEQILHEHRVLRDAGQDVGLAIPFMGRRHYCPLLKEDERFRDGTPEELGRLCRDAKRKALQAHTTGKPVKGSCPFYERLLADGTGPIEGLLESHDGDPAQLADRISNAGSCPYEALKQLIPQARLVIVPTIFVMEERLRMALLEWMGRAADEVRLVIDEAHHLPEAVRQLYSPRLGLGTLERALKEAEELQDPSLAGRVLATQLITTMHALIRDLTDEHAGEEDDAWIPEDAFTEALMVRLQTPGPALGRIAAELEEWGEAIREKRRQAGRLPRSYLGAVGSFLQFWMAARDGPYVHLVVREPRPAIEAYLLDPAAKCRFLRDFGSSIHLSGTLAPLETHARLIGLGRVARQVQQPSPFDPERLRVYGIHGIRREHGGGPEGVAKQQDAGRSLLERWQGRRAVFFPSHQMLQDHLEEGFLHGHNVYQETPGMNQAQLQTLLGRFRQDPDGVLAGVLGGRLTEGIDYPGELLEHMLIMGVPYPKPSARSRALIRHFGMDGWRIAVHDPTGRTLRQAIGRLIRSESDEGTAVVLDDRIIRFRDHIPRLRMAKTPHECRDDPPPQQEGFVLAQTIGRGSGAPGTTGTPGT